MGIPQVFVDVETAGVLAVLVIDRASDAVPVAEALEEGGVGAMELTLRTDAAIEALRRIRKAVPLGWCRSEKSPEVSQRTARECCRWFVARAARRDCERRLGKHSGKCAGSECGCQRRERLALSFPLCQQVELRHPPATCWGPRKRGGDRLD